METSGDANSMVVGQFVGDELPDIVVTGPNASTVEIWMQVPGHFYPIQTIYVAGDARFLIAADFNGDGDLQIVTSNTVGDNVTLLNKAGEYSYEIAASYYTGDGPWDMAAADVTGDDLPDLIVANGWDQHISVLSALPGSDYFNSNSIYYCGYGPGTVIPGDFDNDGIVEVVVLREDDGLMVYMENDGAGHLSLTASYEIGGVGVEVKGGTAVDISGDEIPDLILAVNRFDPDEADYIRVLTNNGVGIFTQTSVHDTGELPVLMAAEDLNGWGVTDLVVPCYGDGGFDVFLGDALQGFLHHGFIEAGAGARDAAILDLNGDAYPDLAIACRGEDRIYLFENRFADLTTAPDGSTPAGSGLLGIAPNPFNPKTRIRYLTDTAGPLDISVHDLSGRRVRSLREGFVEAGAESVVWDGRDDHGAPLASGVYLVRMSAGATTTHAKAVLLK